MHGVNDRKRKMLLAICTGMTILWMGVIFSMSAAKGEASSSMSMKVGHAVGHLVVHDFSSLSKKEQNEFALRISFPVRKTAHFMEYALLGALLFADVSLLAKKHSVRMVVIAVAIGVFYSCSDEFHQMFVVGRSAESKDVLIDGCGALCGAVVLFLFCRNFDIMKGTERSATIEKQRE